MDREINWMNIDGHLKDDDAAKTMREIQLKIHDARKVFERLE